MYRLRDISAGESYTVIRSAWGIFCLTTSRQRIFSDILGIFCMTMSRSSVSAYSYRLVLVNIWAELCPRRSPPSSLEFSLSTHLRSNITIKKTVRSTSSVHYPASTSLCLFQSCISAPLFTLGIVGRNAPLFTMIRGIKPTLPPSINPLNGYSLPGERSSDAGLLFSYR